MPVYFIQAGENGPIKIGVAKNVSRRIASIQTGNSIPIKLIRSIEGNNKTEKWLHGHFKHLNVRGEWFTYDPSMLTIEVPTIAPTVPKNNLRERNHSPITQLQNFLQSANMDEGMFAEKIGVTPEAVRLWLNGERIPSKKYMPLIIAATRGKVEPNHFYEDSQ